MRYIKKCLSIGKLFYLRICKRNIIINNLFKSNIKLSTRISVAQKGRIYIGSLEAESNILIAAIGEGYLKIGHSVFLNRNTIIACRKKIIIHDNCIFGPNVCIYDHDHSFNENGRLKGSSYKSSDIIIEENCWIGAGCIILRGTHIGANSIIGAGIVLKGEIPSNSLLRLNANLSMEKLK